MEIQKIAVLGAGLMGHGIAQVVAQSGFSVTLRDIDQGILDKGLDMIQKSLERLMKAGKLKREETPKILQRIIPTLSFEEAVREADVIIEAVPEDLALKKRTFKELDRAAPPQAILASNTSQLSITALAAMTKRPEKVIGMHWFNPPQIMKLIEIVRGVLTSDETVRTIEELSHRLGKETVVCKDSQGFITSRVLSAFLAECFRVYEEGVASKEDIDKAVKLGLNYPMGPFELADYLGLDTVLHVHEGLTEAFGERFLVPQTLKKLVEAGHYGRKTGSGFYGGNPPSP